MLHVEPPEKPTRETIPARAPERVRQEKTV
jgi:hypothetical protein